MTAINSKRRASSRCEEGNNQSKLLQAFDREAKRAHMSNSHHVHNSINNNASHIKQNQQPDDIMSKTTHVKKMAHPSSNELMVFLPCHLNMLKSLYEDQTNNQEDPLDISNLHESSSSSSHDTSTIGKEIWDQIKLFLSKRQYLSKCQVKAARLHGILDESNKEIRLMSSKHQVQKHSSSATSPLGIMTPKVSLSFTTQAQRRHQHSQSQQYFEQKPSSSFIHRTTTNYQTPRRTKISNSKKSPPSSLQQSLSKDPFSPFAFHQTTMHHKQKPQQLPPSSTSSTNTNNSSHSILVLPNSTNNDRHYHHEGIGEERANSLNLVHLLMKKKCTAIDDNTQIGKKPFESLVRVVDEKVKELEGRLVSLSNCCGRSTRRGYEVFNAESMDRHFWDDDEDDGNDGGMETDDILGNGLLEEERVVMECTGKTKSKLSLWRLLARSLKEIMVEK